MYGLIMVTSSPTHAALRPGWPETLISFNYLHFFNRIELRTRIHDFRQRIRFQDSDTQGSTYRLDGIVRDVLRKIPSGGWKYCIGVIIPGRLIHAFNSFCLEG